MSVKKSNKQLYRVIQIMTLTGTLVVANVLFTMVTHRHIWSGQDVLDTQIASSIVNTSVEAKRGTIYDRNHNVIAQEVTAYTVVAYLDDSLEDEDGNPDYVKDADYTAKQLGTVLDNINEEKQLRSQRMQLMMSVHKQNWVREQNAWIKIQWKK